MNKEKFFKLAKEPISIIILASLVFIFDIIYLAITDDEFFSIEVSYIIYFIAFFFISLKAILTGNQFFKEKKRQVKDKE